MKLLFVAVSTFMFLNLSTFAQTDCSAFVDKLEKSVKKYKSLREEREPVTEALKRITDITFIEFEKTDFIIAFGNGSWDTMRDSYRLADESFKTKDIAEAKAFTSLEIMLELTKECISPEEE